MEEIENQSNIRNLVYFLLRELETRESMLQKDTKFLYYEFEVYGDEDNKYENYSLINKFLHTNLKTKIPYDYSELTKMIFGCYFLCLNNFATSLKDSKNNHLDISINENTFDYWVKNGHFLIDPDIFDDCSVIRSTKSSESITISQIIKMFYEPYGDKIKIKRASSPRR